MKITMLCAALAAAAMACACVMLASSTDPLSLFHHVAGGIGVDTVSAMGMIGIPLNQRARGLIGMPRADAGNANAIIEEIQRSFEAFKAERNKEIADLKKGMGDYVQSEKVDRINAEITKLQKAIDDTNALMAALKVGGSGSEKVSPEASAYHAAFDKYFRRGVDAGLSDLAVKAALTTDSDPDGGYVVSPQMETTIDRVLSTVSAMRSISRVIQISSGVYKKPIGLGGATSGWVGEREARPQTNTPVLGVLEFPAMELYAMPAATQTMLDDASINVENWLGDEISIVFAEQEGAAFISGSGVNKPRGLLAYDTIADTSYTWGKLGFVGTGASDFATEDPGDALIDLVYSLKQGYRQNARFLMNRKTQAKVRKFKDDQDNYLWQPGIQAGQPGTLLGYPITDDDNMSDTGANAFPVAFGDFQRGYLIVDRTGVRVLRDPYSAKPYVLFYTTKRVGGGVQNFEAIKLLKNA